MMFNAILLLFHIQWLSIQYHYCRFTFNALQSQICCSLMFLKCLLLHTISFYAKTFHKTSAQLPTKEKSLNKIFRSPILFTTSSNALHAWKVSFYPLFATFCRNIRYDVAIGSHQMESGFRNAAVQAELSCSVSIKRYIKGVFHLRWIVYAFNYFFKFSY